MAAAEDAVAIAEHAATCLLNAGGTEALTARYDAIFDLIAARTQEAVRAMCAALRDPRETSVLLRHEIAYGLGQIGSPDAVPTLSRVLEDVADSDVVRHEAAEALGAIGAADALPLLHRFAEREGEAPVVTQTCQLAIKRIAEVGQVGGRPLTVAGTDSAEVVDVRFDSVDPAPPVRTPLSIPELRSLLLDPTADLYDRYKAMFSLRNAAGAAANPAEAADALCAGLLDEPSGALFRHEVAYVLGQLQLPLTVWALRRVLEKDTEPAIVRHECAEALGSIATPECLEVLSRWKADTREVVAQSCQVALDILEFETSDKP